MRITSKLVILAFGMLCFTSCSKNGDSEPEFALSGFSPASGTVGTEVTISGTNFPSNPSEIEVSIGGAKASVVTTSTTQLVVTVPAGAISGDIAVKARGYTKFAEGQFTVLSELVSQTFENLEAPQTGGQGAPVGGPFVKFNFETGSITDSESDWDIAFRGTTIAVNGGTQTGTADEPERNGNAGAVILNATFDDVASAEGLVFEQDASGAFAIPTGSDNGWYNYNPSTFTVTPIPGKILVFRTHNGQYVKVEILSYYRDAPAQPDPYSDESRVYTFRFVYNPNPGQKHLAL